MLAWSLYNGLDGAPHRLVLRTKALFDDDTHHLLEDSLKGRPTIHPEQRYPEPAAVGRLVSGELQEKLQKALIIQWTSGGGEQPPVIIQGHDAALLIDVCNAVAHRSGSWGSAATRLTPSEVVTVTLRRDPD